MLLPLKKSWLRPWFYILVPNLCYQECDTLGGVRKDDLLARKNAPILYIAVIYLNKSKFDQVEEFPCLGNMITVDDKNTQEISEYIGLAKAAVNKKAKLFICRKLNLSVEKRLMETYV